MTNPTILFVGGVRETNIGLSLHNAASLMGLRSVLLDTDHAFTGPKLLRTINWRFNDRHPLNIDQFSDSVIEHCRQLRPEVLISTGIAPLQTRVLQQIRNLNITRVNFQTDDPWNASHRSNWYLEALQEYDYIFTPRSSTLEQLCVATTAKLRYLPFGYDELLFFPEKDPTALGLADCSDVLFAGGADKDRIAPIELLINSGLNIALFGGYWNRHKFASRSYRGMASAALLRAAHAKAKVAVGMVRRANRDGNSMRTFELAAMGACCVMEETEDHRTLFGPEGDAVLYFNSSKSLVEKCMILCEDDALRARLAAQVLKKVENGHSYRDRLAAILSEIGLSSDRHQIVAAPV